MVNNITRSALLLVLVVSISACGFHLRGNIPLSEGITNLFVSAPEGTFKNQLLRVLDKGGATVSENEGGVDAILVVTKAATNRKVGTLNERGRANSYNLTFTVTYSLVDPYGDNIRPAQTVKETRRFNFDPETVVETEAEEAELQESMEKDVSLRIVRQLSTITDYEPK